MSAPNCVSGPLDVYVDGSFHVSTALGGWAFVVFEGDRRLHAAAGTAVGATNNSFEVMAVVQAMSWIETAAFGQRCTLWTDSAHVFNGCRRWRAIWRNNGWKRINSNPRARRRAIPDDALWRQLDAFLDHNPMVDVRWCKGHSGIAGNDLADALANTSLDR
jgi:ribonuclease HI